MRRIQRIDQFLGLTNAFMHHEVALCLKLGPVGRRPHPTQAFGTVQVVPRGKPEPSGKGSASVWLDQCATRSTTSARKRKRRLATSNAVTPQRRCRG